MQLRISNQTSHYYFRKNFTIANFSAAGMGVLNVLADDDADIYVNGDLVLSTTTELGTYWNRKGVLVPQTYLRSGSNVIAAELRSKDGAAKFNLEFALLNTTRPRAMMVMSDGVANKECNAQSTGSSTLDAIRAACDAREDYGIAVYSVGFSDEADEGTLESIAECGEGLFKKSSDTAELQEFYQDVAYSIIEASISSQTVVVEGTYETSILYNDSYLNISYIPQTYNAHPEEIELLFQSSPFGSCSPSVQILDGIRIVDASVTSYSGSHWTDIVTVNGATAFNLSRFSDVYLPLGDPYRVMVPSSLLVPGILNNLTMRTGDSPGNGTSCSPNNTLIYRAFVNSSTPRSEVVDLAVGCRWTMSFSDGTNMTTSVPGSYGGAKNCSYTVATYPGVFDVNDAYDLAVARILDRLDFDDNGLVDVNLNAEDLEIIVNVVTGVPYLWGPSFARLEVSR